MTIAARALVDAAIYQTGTDDFGEDTEAMHQCGVRYTWDDEAAYGMIERSYPADKIRFR